MSRRYRFGNKANLHFVSYATVGWIDLFIRNGYKSIILDSLLHCMRHKGADIYGWVIMTNHVHLVISSRDKPLEDIIRDHKRYTSTALRAAIEKEVAESRREWMMDLFKRAGKGSSNNSGFRLWSSIIRGCLNFNLMCLIDPETSSG